VLDSISSTISEWLATQQKEDSKVVIIEDNRFEIIKDSFLSINPGLQIEMKNAARAGLKRIIPFEPHLWSGTQTNPVSIQVNTNAGGSGDVRDVIFIKHMSTSGHIWEIGASCKWNHKALKHSRLSKDIDFGYEWLGHQCSNNYWEGIRPYMDELENLRGNLWRDLDRKFSRFYQPILNEFLVEMKLLAEKYADVPLKLAEYFLGRYDFYKIIGQQQFRRTLVQPFNIHNSLNQREGETRPINLLENQSGGMPTCLIDIRFINNSQNKIAIIMDQGWQFNLRIHNADTRISPSLKFDITFAGSPVASFLENW